MPRKSTAIGTMRRRRGRWASTTIIPSRTPLPQIAIRVCTSFSNIGTLRNPELKHRAGIPTMLRAEVADPSHLGKLATAGPDLHCMNTRCPGIHPPAIDVVHFIIRRDIEPVQPEADASRDIG